MADVPNLEIKGEGTPVPESVVLSDVEQKAANHGWKPQDQFEGEPGDWRTAKEFLDRQSLFDKIDSLKSTIWELKREYKTVHDTVAKAEKAKFDTEILRLKAERKQAAKEGDTEAVVDISDRLEQVAAQAAVVVPQSTQATDPAFSEWVSQNKWYNDSPELKKEADAIGQTAKLMNPNISFQEVLSEVNKKMRKLYPDELGVKAKPNAAAVDGGGSSQRPAVRSNKGSEADLNEMERDVMKKMVKLKIYGNIPEAEAKAKYIASLNKRKEAS